MMGFHTLLKHTLRPLRWFKHTSRKKKTITLVLLVILLVVLLRGVLGSGNTQGYTFAKAKRTNLSEIVSESGNITTGSSTIVYSPANGVLTEVLVANGDEVQEGQILFVVRSTATDQEQQTAYANYLAAVATLNAAKSTADSYRALMYEEWKSYTDLSTNSTYETDDGKAKEQEREAAEFQIARDQWKAAEAKFKDQQTAIAQAQAQVNATSLLYQATQNATVKATIDAKVTNLAFSEGGAVKAYTPTVPTTPVLVLATTTATEATISLNELDASKVQQGQNVVVDVNAVDGKTYRGVVARVDEIGTEAQGVVIYNAYITLLNPDNALKSGMSTDVEITTKELKDVLAVPNAAVKPYQGGRAVRVLDPKTQQPVYTPVIVGIRGEKLTQIVKGLTEGQEVITALSNDQIKRPGLF